jgi:predicted ferric reductase
LSPGAVFAAGEEGDVTHNPEAIGPFIPRPRPRRERNGEDTGDVQPRRLQRQQAPTRRRPDPVPVGEETGDIGYMQPQRVQQQTKPSLQQQVQQGLQQQVQQAQAQAQAQSKSQTQSQPQSRAQQAPAPPRRRPEPMAFQDITLPPEERSRPPQRPPFERDREQAPFSPSRPTFSAATPPAFTVARPEGLAGHPVRRRSRSGDGARPDRRNLLALTAGGIGAFVVLLLFWAKTPGLTLSGAEAFTTVGDGLGMLTAYLLMVEVLLMARIPWLERGIGSDRLAAVHRVVGESVVCVLLAHVATITWGYSGGKLAAVTAELPVLFIHTPYVLLASVGTSIFVLIGLISVRFVRRRLSYELWYYIHLGVYASLALAFAHQIALGPTFDANRMARVAWSAAYLLVAAMVLIHRIGGPLRLAYRHRLVVTRVEPEGPDAVSIYLGGRQLRRLNAEPGQFFRWRFLAAGSWWQAHPFSLSAAPNREWLRITVGALGNHTKALQNVRPGTKVLAEGPYGAFTAALRTRGKVLLLAGGIGITPLRALVDALASVTHDIVLVYRASDRESVVFGEELAWLDRTGQLKLHYLLGPRDVDPAPLSPERLSRLIPDVADRDVFLCGPPGMVDSARRALREAGVPGRRMHHERFST